MPLFKSIFIYSLILGLGLAGLFFALPSEEDVVEEVIQEEPLPVETVIDEEEEENVAVEPKNDVSQVEGAEVEERVVQDPYEAVLEAFSELETVTKPVSPETQPTPPPQPVQGVNAAVRASIVNIVCTTAGAGPFNPISATGVFIHPQGVILTNAHVAQFFLLKDYPSEGFVECIARTGSPAKPLYKLELLFLPPSWILENAAKINDETPRGNGENDYALLRVTGGVSSSVEIPSAFPYLPVSLETPVPGTPVLLSAYPAGFLGGVTIQKELYAVSSNATIGEIFTYGGNTPDLFSVGGTIVAQQGSSGGAVVDASGILRGLIVTSSEGATTGERDLRALSTTYIIKSFALQSGGSLEAFLSGNLAQQAQTFNITTAPTLSKTLIQALNN